MALYLQPRASRRAEGITADSSPLGRLDRLTLR